MLACKNETIKNNWHPTRPDKTRQPHQPVASLAQLAEHALRKRMVMGSIPIGGYLFQVDLPPKGWRLRRSQFDLTLSVNSKGVLHASASIAQLARA